MTAKADDVIAAPHRRIIALLQRGITSAGADAKEEAWKVRHLELQYVWALEDLLERMVRIYEHVMRLDLEWRNHLYCDKDTSAVSEDLRDLDAVLESWKRIADDLEKKVRSACKREGKIDHAEEFLRCHAEAGWIAADEKSLFDNDQFSELSKNRNE